MHTQPPANDSNNRTKHTVMLDAHPRDQNELVMVREGIFTGPPQTLWLQS